MKSLILPIVMGASLLPLGSLSAGDHREQPVGVIKGEDLRRARENLDRYDWAKAYLNAKKSRVAPWLDKIDRAFLEQYIPATTPGAMLFTPCPSCRDKERPYLPHGNWTWTATAPEQIVCKQCTHRYPSPDYPEEVVITTQWGKPQRFTYIGGEPFVLFGYKNGRPSMSGNIRAQKVNWSTRLLDDLGELYALTGETRYAAAAKSILLRLADVYPHWLIHTGYGEIADSEPALAARNLNKLPASRMAVPPNPPARALYAGYWQAGRARAEGMEGTFVRIVCTAYDFIRHAKREDGHPLLNPEEKAHIEKNLLAESIPLLISDPGLNNKSVGNRAAVGIVGMVLQQPEWVRFGLEGFLNTVNDWFLPDGTTPESPAYANMTLGGIVEFGQALRGYSDPPGYQDANGQRYDNFNPYHDTHYREVWAAMYGTLQGDLRYPPFADSYLSTGIGAAFAELMAANYPENANYQALRKELTKGTTPYAPYALYLSSAKTAEQETPPLTFESKVFPELRIGWMRTGQDGREALLLLSASHWGGHHHLDSLNLTYWNQGSEILSDLGYLWDHPEREKTVRTLAHNTVLIDGKDQASHERGGEVHAFINEPHVKGMRASSNAYPNATRYERTVILVDHHQSQHYIIDVFRVEGGTVQDYVYHGPTAAWSAYAPASSTVRPAASSNTAGWLERLRQWWTPRPPAPQASLPPAPEPAIVQPANLTLYDLADLKEIGPSPGSPNHLLQWDLGKNRTFSAWHLPVNQESLYIGQGWGQRDFRNGDRGATLPYIVRRTEGSGPKTFVSIFEVSPQGASLVKSVRKISEDRDGSIALEIETAHGSDLALISPARADRRFEVHGGTFETNGAISILSLRSGKVRFHYTDQGQIRFKPSKRRE